MCNMTHSYIWHASCTLPLTPATWLIHMWDMTHLCVTLHIHECDMTHSYVQHDALINLTCLMHIAINTRDVTHPYVGHDTFIGVTWHIYRCDKSHAHLWRDSHFDARHDAFMCVTCLIHFCDVTHLHVYPELNLSTHHTLPKHSELNQSTRYYYVNVLN